MKEIVSLLIFSFFMTTSAKGNATDTSICKCRYYSSFEINEYKKIADSIGEILYDKYGNLLVIGERSFSGANLLFIVKRHKEYRGFFYNLGNKKSRVIDNITINQMAVKILTDSNAIKHSDKIPCKFISHDFSFFVSFGRTVQFYEVCYSQVLSVKSKPIGRLFSYYMKNFM